MGLLIGQYLLKLLLSSGGFFSDGRTIARLSALCMTALSMEVFVINVMTDTILVILSFS